MMEADRPIDERLSVFDRPPSEDDAASSFIPRYSDGWLASPRRPCGWRCATQTGAFTQRVVPNQTRYTCCYATRTAAWRPAVDARGAPTGRHRRPFARMSTAPLSPGLVTD